MSKKRKAERESLSICPRPILFENCTSAYKYRTTILQEVEFAKLFEQSQIQTSVCAFRDERVLYLRGAYQHL